MNNLKRIQNIFFYSTTIYQDSITVILVEEIVSHCRFSENFTRTPPNNVGNCPRFLLRSLDCRKTVLIAAGPILNSSNRSETVHPLRLYCNYRRVTGAIHANVAGSCSAEAEMSRVFPRFRKLLRVPGQTATCGIVNLSTIHLYLA